MCDITFLDEETVESLFDFNEIYNTIKRTLTSISLKYLKDDEREKRFGNLKIMNPRRISSKLVTDNGTMVCILGHIIGYNPDHPAESALGCKIVSMLPGNTLKTPPTPLISGYIFLFDDNDGKLFAILNAAHITEWRTAATTCIATELLWKPKVESSKKILAIFGAGVQGRIHAIFLQKVLRFDEIRIWNRTKSKAENLITELNSMNLGTEISLSPTCADCAMNADVIVTATSAYLILLRSEWVKAGAHINAIGIDEVEADIYERADVYVEDSDITNVEYPHITLAGELGQLILGLIENEKHSERVTIFRSRGTGIADASVAKTIYNKWIVKNKTTPTD